MAASCFVSSYAPSLIGGMFMRTLSENEARTIVGGGHHCIPCHYYYGGKQSVFGTLPYTYYTTAGLALHTLSSSHKKAVKAVGYGHRC